MGEPKPDDLVDEIEQIRERLADTVDELIDRAHPKAVARRSLARLRARFVTEDGSPDLTVIAPIVGGVVVLVVGSIAVRRALR